VGHLRDPRRLVVAMSRARLGLYVFGRRNLFENCYELTPAFSVLMGKNRPDQLALIPGEQWENSDRKVKIFPFAKIFFIFIL
jgi:intron-binding protein aquarius